MLYMESHNAAHQWEKDMKIHSTSEGHVIETDSPVRPFRIHKGERLCSYKTLEAAIEAAKLRRESILADYQAVLDCGKSY